MEYLDIVDLGEISSDLAIGIHSLNKYKNYNTPTLFLCKKEKAIVKFGLSQWSNYTNMSMVSDYKRSRVLTRNALVDSLHSSNSIPFNIIFPHPNPGSTFYNKINNAVINTFSIFNIIVNVTDINKFGSYTVFYNGENRLLGGFICDKGTEYPCISGTVMINYERFYDEEDIIFKLENLIKCYNNISPGITTNSNSGINLKILNENITREDIVLFFQEELSKTLNLPINKRELTSEENILLSHIEESFSDSNWIENATHPDFLYYN